MYPVWSKNGHQNGTPSQLENVGVPTLRFGVHLPTQNGPATLYHRGMLSGLLGSGGAVRACGRELTTYGVGWGRMSGRSRNPPTTIACSHIVERSSQCSRSIPCSASLHLITP